VVEIKPDASPDAVMAYLFRHTSLQLNFNVNLTALVPTSTAGVGQPARLDLKEMCRHFLDFRLEIVTRRLEHELQQLRERLHILAGFLKLFGNIDKAIRIIRKSESRQAASNELRKAFGLDEVQAEAVLEKQKRAKEIERLLTGTKARWKLIESELEEVAKTYGDARRTALSAGAELVYDAEAYIVHESTTVVVTRDGWIKRLGEVKDPSTTRVREGDVAKWVLRGNTRDNLVLFSNLGVAYVLQASNVPPTTGYGDPVQTFMNFKDSERVVVAALAPPPSGQKSEKLARWLVASAGGMGLFCRPDLSETTKNGRRFAR
jgi:DNA gyrase subunit A